MVIYNINVKSTLGGGGIFDNESKKWKYSGLMCIMSLSPQIVLSPT